MYGFAVVVDYYRDFGYTIIRLLLRGERMDYMTELAAIANKNGGIIETKTAAQRGISKAMLYKLCKAEKIHRIVKGQYVLPEDIYFELYHEPSCFASI